MKKVTGIHVYECTCADDVVTATIGITGSVKEAEVNPKWIATKLSYTVTIRCPLADVLTLYGADLRIAVAGRLRKCDYDFVKSLDGSTHSLNALDAMIDAATPETAGSGAKAQAAKLRTMLKGMGLSDEEIDKKLAEL